MKSPIPSLVDGPRIATQDREVPLVGRAPNDSKERPFDTHLGTALGKPKPRPEARGRSVDPRDKKPAHASKTHDRSAKTKAAREDDEKREANEAHEEKRASREREVDEPTKAVTATEQQPSAMQAVLTMPTAFVPMHTAITEPAPLSPSTATVQAATEHVQTAWCSAPEKAATETSAPFATRLDAALEQAPEEATTTAPSSDLGTAPAPVARNESAVPTVANGQADIPAATPLTPAVEAKSTPADMATVTKMAEASSATAAIASSMTPSPTNGPAPEAEGDIAPTAPKASPSGSREAAPQAMVTDGADVRSRGTRTAKAVEKTPARPLTAGSPGSSGLPTGGPGTRAQTPAGEPGTAPDNLPPLVAAANESASSALTSAATSSPARAEIADTLPREEAKTESAPATIVGTAGAAPARAETGAVEPGATGVIHSAPHVNRLTGESAPSGRAPVDLTTAVREAEAVGHKRALGGEAHGAITLENGGKFEVRARSHESGHVDVQVRAEEEIGRSMLHQHASELRADLRAEIPRASVTLPDMSSGAGGGRDSRAHEGQSNGQGFGGSRPSASPSGIDSAKQLGNSASGPRQSSRVRIVL